VQSRTRPQRLVAQQFTGMVYFRQSRRERARSYISKGPTSWERLFAVKEATLTVGSRLGERFIPPRLRPEIHR
jgi:hypothetical protein